MPHFINYYKKTEEIFQVAPNPGKIPTPLTPLYMERNVVGWFEIPVTDMDRAIKFYETVLDLKIDLHNMEDFTMGWFPMVENKDGSPGALVKHPMYKPSKEGTVVYFTAHSGDLTNELGRVEAAGGKVLQEKKAIGEYGFMGLVEDTKGNAIALHSRK